MIAHQSSAKFHDALYELGLHLNRCLCRGRLGSNIVQLLLTAVQDIGRLLEQIYAGGSLPSARNKANQADQHFATTWQLIVPVHIHEAQTDVRKVEELLHSAAAYVQYLEEVRLSLSEHANAANALSSRANQLHLQVVELHQNVIKDLSYLTDHHDGLASTIALCHDRQRKLEMLSTDAAAQLQRTRALCMRGSMNQDTTKNNLKATTVVLEGLLGDKASLTVAQATISMLYFQDEALLRKNTMELDNTIHRLCTARDALANTTVENKVLLDAQHTHQRDETVLQMVALQNNTKIANLNKGMEAFKGVIMHANAKETGECCKVKQSYEHNLDMEKILISRMRQEAACLAFLQKIETDIKHSSTQRHQTKELQGKLHSKLVLGQQDHAKYSRDGALVLAGMQEKEQSQNAVRHQNLRTFRNLQEAENAIVKCTELLMIEKDTQSSLLAETASRQKTKAQMKQHNGELLNMISSTVLTIRRMNERVEAKDHHADRLASWNLELNTAILRDEAVVYAVTQQLSSLRHQCSFLSRVLVQLKKELYHASSMAGGLEAVLNSGFTAMVEKGALVQRLQTELRNISSFLGMLQRCQIMITRQENELMKDKGRHISLQSHCWRLASVLQDPQRHGRWRVLEGRIPSCDMLNVKMLASRRHLAILLQLMTVKNGTLANLRQLNVLENGLLQCQRYSIAVDSQKVLLLSKMCMVSTRLSMANKSELSTMKGSTLKDAVMVSILSMHNRTADCVLKVDGVQVDCLSDSRYRSGITRKVSAQEQYATAVQQQMLPGNTRPAAYYSAADGVPIPYGSFSPFKPQAARCIEQ